MFSFYHASSVPPHSPDSSINIPLHPSSPLTLPLNQTPPTSSQYEPFASSFTPSSHLSLSCHHPQLPPVSSSSHLSAPNLLLLPSLTPADPLSRVDVDGGSHQIAVPLSLLPQEVQGSPGVGLCVHHQLQKSICCLKRRGRHCNHSNRG